MVSQQFGSNSLIKNVGGVVELLTKQFTRTFQTTHTTILMKASPATSQDFRKWTLAFTWCTGNYSTWKRHFSCPKYSSVCYAEGSSFDLGNTAWRDVHKFTKLKHTNRKLDAGSHQTNFQGIPTRKIFKTSTGGSSLHILKTYGVLCVRQSTRLLTIHKLLFTTTSGFQRRPLM